MDKKEKALRFGISILESVSDLLTAAVVGILLVAGLIHYFNWKYDREKELNPPETAAPVIVTPEPVSPSDSSEAGGAASLKTHPLERRDCPVTTMEIITLCFVIIGISGLFIQANKK